MTTKRAFSMDYKTYTGTPGSPRAWRAAFAETMGLDEARARVGRETPESILGVAVGAVWAAVVTAFKMRAMQCHPDRCAVHGLSADVATERMKQLLAAFTVLKHRYGQ